MKVYLVRHGVTGGNIAHRHQADTTSLTVEGIIQAKEVAKKIKELEPTHLVSSNLIRAIETVSIIGQECNLIPSITDLFTEIIRPHSLYGYHHRSLKSFCYYTRWLFGKTNPEIEGGETYDDLRLRALKAQEFLKVYPSDARVVVVSHSAFMNLFVAHLCKTKPLTFLEAVKCFNGIITIPNVHVVPLEFEADVEAPLCGWRQ